MVKSKKYSVHLPLVITGYSLFFLLVLATLFSTTIPFGRMLFDPRVLHGNVAIITLSLTIGAILPSLIGYIIGSYSVKSKNKSSHHFNGVLLGVLGYWLMTSWAVMITVPDVLIPDQNLRVLLINLLPIVAVAIIASILAIMHIRNRNAKEDLLEYWPYSVLLIASIFLLPVWSLLYSSIARDLNVYSFITLIIVFVIGLISYVGLRKARLSRLRKLSWSALSVSIVFIAMYVSDQIANAIAVYIYPYPTAGTQLGVSLVGYGIALIGWGVYWHRQVKSLNK